MLVKCCSLQQRWALGKLAGMQARQGHRSQAFPTSTCPAVLLGGIAGKGGLGTPPSALAGHRPTPVHVQTDTPNQLCRAALLTVEGSGPGEFIRDCGPSLGSSMEATPGAWGVLAGARGCLYLPPPRLTPHRGLQGNPRGCGGGDPASDALRNQVLMRPPPLGPLLPVLGDDCVLIELVSQIAILGIEHGAVAARDSEGRRGGAKACSATAASGPPPPTAENKGRRPQGLGPPWPMSGPPTHGGPAAASLSQGGRHRLPRAPLSPTTFFFFNERRIGKRRMRIKRYSGKGMGLLHKMRGMRPCRWTSPGPQSGV